MFYRNDEPVTGCALWKQFVVVTHGTGVIRLYSVENFNLCYKIFSHNGWVFGSDISYLNTDMLLTFSEDDMFRIWKLAQNEKKEVLRTYKNNTTIKND